MFFKLLKIAVFTGLIFFGIKVVMGILFKLMGKTVNEKDLMKYSLIGTVVGVICILMSSKKEGFESEETEEDVEETEETEENIEEEVDEEQEIHTEEGEPSEQDEDLKTEIQGNLQTLLNDMVEKTAEQEEIDSQIEPKPSTNTALVRTKLDDAQNSIEQDKSLATMQPPVEETGFAKAMISPTEEEPRPLPELDDFGGNKYTLKPVEEWLRPNLAEDAMKTGCQCPVYSAFSGANWATV